MRHEPLRIVAHLASPLAGDAPQMDSLLVSVASRLLGKPADVEPGYKVDRRSKCPDTSGIPIGMSRQQSGQWLVAMTTSPILGQILSDTTEHVAKRIAVEHAGELADDERKVVTTTNGWTKSYRLPLRIRRVERVAWLCLGNRREVKSLLKEVLAIGKKASMGYGRVDDWQIDRLDVEFHRYWPWWIESDAGPVLMRPLPYGWSGLPDGLIAARRDYGACVDPYWHPERFTEIVVPC